MRTGPRAGWTCTGPGPATSPTTVVNQTICYAAGAIAPACDRASATADRTKIRWISDAVSGETTTYSYDSAGRLTQAAVTGGPNPGVSENPYLYGGGLQDRATGNLKYGARWYDPATGAWTQQDTRNTPLDPGNANRYQYAAGDPINNADPTGLSCSSLWDCVSTPFIYGAEFAGVGAATGGAIGCLVAGGPFNPPGCVSGAATGAAIGGFGGFFVGFGYGLSVDIWGD